MMMMILCVSVMLISIIKCLHHDVFGLPVNAVTQVSVVITL